MKGGKIFTIFIFFILISSYTFTTSSEKIESYELSGSNKDNKIINNDSQKSQLRFAAFTDTHIGGKYQYPYFELADHLDSIGRDLVENTNKLDFAINLGDIINHNVAQIHGNCLPWYVNQYKNNMKAYHVSNINLPFHFVLGNHDINDYEMNKDDPHNITKSLIDELNMNNPVYAMMRDGILFLIVPELGYVTWTHPVEYEWIEYMAALYPDTTTIILSHQAIEDTTEEQSLLPYRGKQDMDWWASLFQNNSQIKMWIHGHNHYLGWYVGNKTTGETPGYPIYEFGHQMAFSSPYAQLDWGKYHEEDRIVIYNITSSNITTITWENNGYGGHWVSEYENVWNVQTTYNPDAEDWYSFPMFLQDNETQLTDMKILSPNITLQLVGTVPMELFYDSKMESPNGWSEEIILGFGDDRTGKIERLNPGMKASGPTFVTFPEKEPYYEDTEKQEDGRSGQPYHSFPMGTICAAVPGQTYNFTITAKCDSGLGRFNMSVNCTDWGTRSQYSVLSDSESQVFSHTFGSSYETIYGTYTVPKDENAWFLQGRLDFLDSTDYNVTLFSVKRERSSDSTKDFHLHLSKNWYNFSGIIYENEKVNFTINPVNLSQNDGVMNFTAYIGGNHYGMVNLIYHEPILLGRNARFRVNSYNDTVFNLSLTKTITRNSPIEMVLWNSRVFERYSFLTEFFARFWMRGLLGKIFYWMFSNELPKFKVFPYSTDSIYDQINITADDNSGVRHTSSNGNIWLTCNCPDINERYVEVAINY